MPTDPTDPLAKQNIKDRYHGVNDPVAEKMLRRVDGRPRLFLPFDTLHQILVNFMLISNVPSHDHGRHAQGGAPRGQVHHDFVCRRRGPRPGVGEGSEVCIACLPACLICCNFSPPYYASVLLCLWLVGRVC